MMMVVAENEVATRDCLPLGPHAWCPRVKGIKIYVWRRAIAEWVAVLVFMMVLLVVSSSFVRACGESTRHTSNVIVCLLHCQGPVPPSLFSGIQYICARGEQACACDGAMLLLLVVEVVVVASVRGHAA